MIKQYCGKIYLYTGTGSGKTTNAIGLAIRSVGHKHKVVIVQFMKAWKNTGEYKIRKKLAPYYQIYMFGRYGKIKGWVNLKNPEEVDKKYAEEGLKFAYEIVKKEKPNLLVLDEINLAVAIGLLKAKDVIKFLDKRPKNLDVVLTGRYAPKELIGKADFVNEIIDRKHPKIIPVCRGIQY